MGKTICEIYHLNFQTEPKHCHLQQNKNLLLDLIFQGSRQVRRTKNQKKYLQVIYPQQIFKPLMGYRNTSFTSWLEQQFFKALKLRRCYLKLRRLILKMLLRFAVNFAARTIAVISYARRQVTPFMSLDWFSREDLQGHPYLIGGFKHGFYLSISYMGRHPSH